LGEYSDEILIQVSGFEDIIVPVYGNAVNAPPMVLSASVDSNNVYLNWLSPDGISESLLQYADDEVNSAIGYPSDEGFSASALFTNQELMNYEGKTLTHIGFVPYSSDADFTLKIWGGSDDELIYEQEISDYSIQEWNDIALDEPITITGMDQLRIGYSVVHPSFVFPAGIDAGPAVAGKGDLISLDGTTWQSISDIYDLSNNFMIRGFVQGSDSTVSMLVDNGNQFGNRSTQSELLGYNVYRNGDQLNEDLVIVTEYADENLQAGIYVYEVTAVYDNGESPAAGPVEVTINEPMSLPPGWRVSETGMVHSIFIDNTDSRISGNSLMEEGDLIGLFFPHNDQEVIAGVMQWTNHDTLKIIAYGDNPETIIKEGFENNELMHWRLYKHSTGNTHHMQVEYDHNMPQYDGKFNMLGKSMVKSMSMATSIAETLAEQFKVYPIPARDHLMIQGLESESLVSLINASGQTVWQMQTNENERMHIDVSQFSGIFVLRIQNENGRMNKPVIIE
jgi:hypothetical protein